MTIDQLSIEEALEEAAKSYDGPSFSDLIVKQSEVHQRCNLGCWHVVYRISWRSEYVRVLTIFRQSGAMTTAMLGEYFSGSLGATIRKCPSELIHFGLLEVIGKKHGQKLYRSTTLAHDFLEGLARVPSHVWPEGAPAICRPGVPKFIHQLSGAHPKGDKAEHVSHSIPQTL